MAAKWTFMTYMAGNNNLSEAAGDDLREMRTVGSTDDVRVLAFVKQEHTRMAYHLEVGTDEGSDYREELGDKDSGSPQSIVDFVRWAAKRAPADRYALVIWNHGSGWDPLDLDQLYSEVRGGQGDKGVTHREILTLRNRTGVARSIFRESVKSALEQPTAVDRAIASDDGTGHSVDTVELGNVLVAVAEALDGKLGLLGMDACLMSNLEVAFQVRDHVPVIVASEELEPGDGWPYERVLPALGKEPTMTPTELGAVIVESYIDDYRDRPTEWPVTQCAVDTVRCTDFSAAVGKLSKALRATLKVHWPKVLTAQLRSARFDGDLVDLPQFCRNLLADPFDDAVTKAATALLEATSPGNYVISEGHLGDKVEGVGGISVYFPAPGRSLSKYYGDVRFAKEHGWDEFLAAYHRAVRRG